MKALIVIIGALWCSQARAEVLSPLSFSVAKFELPAFGLLEAAKQKLPSIFASASISGAHVQSPASAARAKIVSHMPVVAPKSEVDTRMPIRTPDEKTDFKLTVKTPDVEVTK